MQNPIAKCDLFKTPESLEEIMEMIKGMSNEAEAYRMVVFTMNYAHSLVESAIKAEQE